MLHERAMMPEQFVDLHTLAAGGGAT